MGLKKIARPINLACKQFLSWMKDNNAECVDDYYSKADDKWDYYRHITGFINDNYYAVCFTMWQGQVKITYIDEENRYEITEITEFLELIK